MHMTHLIDNKKAAYSYVDRAAHAFHALCGDCSDVPSACTGEGVSNMYRGILSRAGFAIMSPFALCDDAFVAVYGAGAPSVGILCDTGETDGVPAFMREHMRRTGAYSAQASVANGACALMAALSLAHALRETGTAGTVIVLGCGKSDVKLINAFMACKDAFESVDMAIAPKLDACETHSRISAVLSMRGALSVAVKREAQTDLYTVENAMEPLFAPATQRISMTALPDESTLASCAKFVANAAINRLCAQKSDCAFGAGAAECCGRAAVR